MEPINKNVIDQMQKIVDIVVKGNLKDFTYDIEELTDFTGYFFWSPRELGTHLMTVPTDDKALNWLHNNEIEKYMFGHKRPMDIMKAQADAFKSTVLTNSENLYFFDGVGLNQVSIETAISSYNRAVVKQLEAAIDLAEKVGI